MNSPHSYPAPHVTGQLAWPPRPATSAELVSVALPATWRAVELAGSSAPQAEHTAHDTLPRADGQQRLSDTSGAGSARASRPLSTQTLPPDQGLQVSIPRPG